MKTRFIFNLCLLYFLLFSATSYSSAYISVADGLWSSPSSWSPYGVPQNDDDVTINNAITLDIDLVSWPHGVNVMIINYGGSLISTGTCGVQIDDQGIFSIFGYMDVYQIYFKLQAEILVESGAEVYVQTNWSTQGENAGDLDPFVVNGNIHVLGTFEDDGSVITGTGSITAGLWDLEGTFLFYNQYDPNNPPDPNQTLYGCTWQGDIDSDWNNPANWYSNEVPTSTEVAYIPAELTVYPVIAGGMSAICNETILESGAYMTIEPGATFSASTKVTNEGDIYIHSNSSGTGSFIDGGGNPFLGTGHIQRFLADMSGISTYYMHQVCSPVSGQILGNYNLIPGRTYAYEFNSTGGNWNNLWIESTPIPVAKGIILSTLNSTGDQVPEFTGTLQTGDIPVSITPAQAVGEIAWNLIGNPYPSPVDWNLIWPQLGIVNVVYIWDPSVPEYKAYVKGTGGSLSCRYIQPGQAFFIGAENTASGLLFQNEQRLHYSAPFMKADESNLLEIYLTGGNGSGSTTLIRLKDGATSAFDSGQEAVKWYSIYGEVANELYSVASDGTALQVAAFPTAENAEVVIPVEVKAAQSGLYSLKFSNLESFDQEMKLFLEDKFIIGQKWCNIRSNPVYEFTSSPNEPTDRFVLHIGREISGTGDGKAVEPSKVYAIASGNVVEIYNPQHVSIEEIDIVDLSGRCLYHQAHSDAGLIRIPLEARFGIYIVKVLTTEHLYTLKVIIG